MSKIRTIFILFTFITMPLFGMNRLAEFAFSMQNQRNRFDLNVRLLKIREELDRARITKELEQEQNYINHNAANIQETGEKIGYLEKLEPHIPDNFGDHTYNYNTEQNDKFLTNTMGFKKVDPNITKLFQEKLRNSKITIWSGDKYACDKNTGTMIIPESEISEIRRTGMISPAQEFAAKHELTHMWLWIKYKKEIPQSHWWSPFRHALELGCDRFAAQENVAGCISFFEQYKDTPTYREPGITHPSDHRRLQQCYEIARSKGLQFSEMPNPT